MQYNLDVRKQEWLVGITGTNADSALSVYIQTLRASQGGSQIIRSECFCPQRAHISTFYSAKVRMLQTACKSVCLAVAVYNKRIHVFENKRKA